MRCRQLLPKIHGAKKCHPLIFLNIVSEALIVPWYESNTWTQFIQVLANAYNKMNCWVCKHFLLGATELTFVWFLYDEFVCFLAYSVIAAASFMSNSVRPHRRQPIRLPRPWDSPGKNNGVGCHFLLQCMKVKPPASPSAFNLSQHQGLFQWINSSHEVAKVLEFQL